MSDTDHQPTLVMGSFNKLPFTCNKIKKQKTTTKDHTVGTLPKS